MSKRFEETQNNAGTSSDSELDDLNCLNFPGDVDWSTTVVLRCDPAAGPYALSDIIHALHDVVRRNEVFNLGATALSHAFTLSFKSNFGLENFIRYMKSPKMSNGLVIKGNPCVVTRIPNKCATVRVKWIPLEVDTAHITEILSKYGTIVKTEWIKSNFRGWFHVYTNERKFTIHLNPDVTAEDLPFGLEVKGLFGAVFVEERNPKCLECYYTGHRNDTCRYKECPFNQP